MFCEKIIRSILIALILKLFGVQGELEVVIEDILCPTYNKEYLTQPDIYLKEDNGAFFNFSIIKQFPPETEAQMTLLGESLGEYVVPTGIDAQMPLCELLDEPVIFSPILKMLGFGNTDCPPPVGIYGSEDTSVPMELLPEVFTLNKYLMTFGIVIGEEKLIVIESYFYVR